MVFTSNPSPGVSRLWRGTDCLAESHLTGQPLIWNTQSPYTWQIEWVFGSLAIAHHILQACKLARSSGATLHTAYRHHRKSYLARLCHNRPEHLDSSKTEVLATLLLT
jgi:hypothetical protein